MKPIEPRSVLVTGASSGIGRSTALALVANGFRVFAGVRKAQDGDRLRLDAGPLLTPIELDVTLPGSIAEAVHKVTEQLPAGALAGLVNNAGIGTSMPMEYVQLERMRYQFEVNVFGQLAVTQAFLPLIRRARGRIVNIGSVGAHIAIPFGGVLCASKSALRSMNDALRMELHPFGIHVCLVEPASVRTPAVDKTLGHVEDVIRALPPEGAARYANMLRRFNRRALAGENAGSPPEVVARAVLAALTSSHPKARYPVGKNASRLVTLPRILPDRMLDRIRYRLFGLPARFGRLPATG